MASGKWHVASVWHVACSSDWSDRGVRCGTENGFWLCKQSGGKLSAASEASEASKANGPADVVANERPSGVKFH